MTDTLQAGPTERPHNRLQCLLCGLFHLADTKKALKETKQFCNNPLLLFRTVSTTKTGHGRQQLVNVRACSFNCAIAECYLHKLTCLVLFQIFVPDNLCKLSFFLLGNILPPFDHHVGDIIDPCNEVFYINQSEYEPRFWNMARCRSGQGDHPSMGYNTANGTYALPAAFGKKLEQALSQESLFRGMTTVIRAYGNDCTLYAKDTNDLAQFVEEGGLIPVYDGIDDFTVSKIGSHKLAVFVKLDEDFVNDAGFSMGEMPILSGMVFCADCGKKLYQVRGRNLPQKEYMVCSTYRKIKGGCSSHQIRNEVLERLILDGIQTVTAYAREHEADFMELITQKSQSELDKSLRDGKREMEQAQARIRKDDIFFQVFPASACGDCLPLVQAPQMYGS